MSWDRERIAQVQLPDPAAASYWGGREDYFLEILLTEEENSCNI